MSEVIVRDLVDDAPRNLADRVRFARHRVQGPLEQRRRRRATRVERERGSNDYCDDCPFVKVPRDRRDARSA
jgi:hypothetical protein